MLEAVKLILITAFLLLSSKAVGEYLNLKWKKPFPSVLGLGYLANLAAFFIISLPVMIFKLSTNALLVTGIVYMLFVIYTVFKTVREGVLFQIKKIDLVVLICSFILLVFYFFVLDFGVIETYDSFFYSSLTNNAANSNHISVVDPYTGMSNLQNFYKYMSYYYLASFLAVFFQVKHAYLVLVWSFTFMNFILIFNTAFTVCRISQNKIVNNIISVFYLSLILSVIRAPFNALHLTTFVVSIYVFRLSFRLFKKNFESLPYLIIAVIACISFTSTSLFTLLPFILVLLIANVFVKDPIPYKFLYYISTPSIILGFLYVYESLKNPIVLLFGAILLVLVYLLFYWRPFNTVVRYISVILGVTLFIVFTFPDKLPIQSLISTNFMQSTAINDDEISPIDNETSEANDNNIECLGSNIVENQENDANYDYKKDMGSSIKYMIGDGDSLLTKLMITVTHSIPKYGGMFFLLVFGFLKRRRSYTFVSFIVYILLFNNPLVSNGVNLITFGLSQRIILFFNTYYAIIGIKYFFDYFVEEIWNKYKVKISLKKLLNLVFYGLAACLMVSILSFGISIKPNSYNEYNFMYKVPNKIVELEDAISMLNLSNGNKYKERYFFTESAFNVKLLDRNGENKITVMNSKEFMNYFGNRTSISDKTIINDYFESEGSYNLSTVVNSCNKIIKTDETVKMNCSCSIVSMLNEYGVDFLVTKKPNDENFMKTINTDYKLVWENTDYVILSNKEVE